MRGISILALGLTALLAAHAGARAEEAPKAPADPLVVHEWGTFTTMSGADGVGLEGLAHEEEALPEFVYSRTKVRECPLRPQGYKGLEVAPSHVVNKMETPVIYVHSRSARSLRVRVEFVGGLLSQWYPVTDLLGPPEGPCDGVPLDLRDVGRSFLEWDVDVLPKGAGTREPGEVPEVDAKDPWAFAREVDASWLRTRPRKGPDRVGPVEAERYLFYRGLGGLELPFLGSLDKMDGPRFENRSGFPVSDVIGLEVGPHGKQARFARAGNVPTGAFTGLALFAVPMRPIDEVIPELEAVVEKVLVGKGLHADEARAMVRTWSRSWFCSEGTRLIYAVPQEVTEAYLPLAITPKPDALVRVLVGRLEVITRAVEREVATALKDAAGQDPAARDAAEARLARLGRFLEPHLRHVLRATRDEAVKTAAQARLDALR
jgi:hypothetical protein